MVTANLNRPQVAPASYLAAADRLRKLLCLRALKRELAALRRVRHHPIAAETWEARS